MSIVGHAPGLGAIWPLNQSRRHVVWVGSRHETEYPRLFLVGDNKVSPKGLERKGVRLMNMPRLTREQWADVPAEVVSYRCRPRGKMTLWSDGGCASKGGEEEPGVISRVTPLGSRGTNLATHISSTCAQRSKAVDRVLTVLQDILVTEADKEIHGWPRSHSSKFCITRGGRSNITAGGG